MKSVMVTLESEFKKHSQQVADQLSAQGLMVERVYPFGVIKGQVDEGRIAAIQARKEVQDVREEKQIGIGPPDNNIF